MNRKIIAVIIIILILSLFACNDDGTDFGDYNESQFDDTIELIANENPAVIVFEQLQLNDLMNEHIPYSVINDELSEDSIKLSLKVSYGSYNNRPEVFRELSTKGDTVFVWYSTRSNESNISGKNETINSIATSPKITFVEVDSIIIHKHIDKSIDFITRLIQ